MSWFGDHLCDTNNHRITDIRRFISLRRHETLSLHDVMQGFRTHDCDSWLGTLPQGNVSRGPGSSDHLKRRDLVEEFLYWFFDSYVISLIKVGIIYRRFCYRDVTDMRIFCEQTTFYVTESSVFKNQILYFRQDDWEILCRPLIDSLMSKTFKKIKMSPASYPSDVFNLICSLFAPIRTPSQTP